MMMIVHIYKHASISAARRLSIYCRSIYSRIWREPNNSREASILSRAYFSCLCMLIYFNIYIIYTCWMDGNYIHGRTAASSTKYTMRLLLNAHMALYKLIQ